MNRHIITTHEGIEASAISKALDTAGIGIESEAHPAHLQGVARLAALVLAEYPIDQQQNARNTLDRWITEALENTES